MVPLPLASFAVVLPAAGSGSRFGDQSNKLFATLAGRPLWTHAAQQFAARDDVAAVWLVVSPADRKKFQSQVSLLTRPEKFRLVIGGRQRSDSVAAALAAISNDSDSPATWVAIHDAARPLIRDAEITDVFARAVQTRAAILATPITGTIKRGAHGDRCQTVDRRNMWQAQTPQVFALDLIRQAYASHRGRPATDDAELVERLGHPVALVPGAADNLKITYPEELLIAEALLRSRADSNNENSFQSS